MFGDHVCFPVVSEPLSQSFPQECFFGPLEEKGAKEVQKKGSHKLSQRLHDQGSLFKV